ncbi:MAG: CHAT domain-containing protein [Desulfamplus sp.]|nr:CHAT domain-containing protein [Desulfamplus sp.]
MSDLIMIKRTDRKNHCRLWLVLFFSFFVFNSIITGSEAAGKPEAATGFDPAAEITRWSEELENSKSMDSIYKTEILLKRGEKYRSLGYYPNARADFTAALETAKELDPSVPLLEIVATQSLGYLHFLMQDMEKAQILLRDALEKADQLSKTEQTKTNQTSKTGQTSKRDQGSKAMQPSSPFFALAASCANHLGNVLAAQNRQHEALKIYEKALDYIDNKEDGSTPEGTNKPGIEGRNDPALEATIHRNIAHVLTDKNASFDHLYTAGKLAGQIDSPEEKARLLLDIAAESEMTEPGQEKDSFRYPLLDQALVIAMKLNDPRLVSLAAGELGALYESRGRVDEAVALTEKAVSSAMIIKNHELLLQWEWQWGKLLQIQGEQKKAIAAYKRALFHVEAVRQDMPVKYGQGCSSFRETLSPIYTGLADMLLKESGVAQSKDEEQKLLRQAQQTVESIKQSELRDYFQDPCIDAMSRQIESLSPSTAVLYPVILPDRLELLADIGGRLYRKTTDVKQDELDSLVTELAGNLRNGLAHEALAKEVYGWVIEPLQNILDEHHVDTLIFVPGGVFRMIPAASLWNGKEYLAQKYAVVTEPGLTLLDPEPLPSGQRTTLLAGMSKPGPVIFDLPASLWNQLAGASLPDVNRGIRGLSIKVVPKQGQGSDNTMTLSDTQALSDSQENQPQSATKTSTGQESATPVNQKQPEAETRTDEHVEKIKKMLSLPGVDKEIENLSKNLQGQKLMNSEFLRDRFSGELKGQDYRIVHIASHGFFGGSPEENFIMTYDKILNMNLLEDFIKPKQFADLPVELLTLSACQTAEGDDRSPLGLSGIALKSGARSVLGSLWPVSDTATQVLLSSFYKNLDHAGTSKAAALQKAQLELIKTREFNHPFYWSAFILVGNWL